MNARLVLGEAAAVLAERAAAYGPPAASMAAIAARWSITLGRPVTLEQGRPLHDRPEARPARARPVAPRSIVDVIGYAALLPEVGA